MCPIRGHQTNSHTGLINLSVDSPRTIHGLIPGGVAGICMKMLPPSSCGMPLVTAASCGFLRDGIEGRWEREAGVGRLLAWKTVPGDTSGQGRGMFHPRPGEPLPTGGGDSPIDTVPREETTTSRSHLILPEILFPPRARLSGLSPCTTRPLEGAGGGAGSAWRRGWSTARMEKTSSVTRRDRGGGCSTPAPASPSPRGRFSHRHSATGGDHYFAVSPDTP
jgi:hypothetical protein